MKKNKNQKKNTAAPLKQVCIYWFFIYLKVRKKTPSIHWFISQTSAAAEAGQGQDGEPRTRRLCLSPESLSCRLLRVGRTLDQKQGVSGTPVLGIPTGTYSSHHMPAPETGALVLFSIGSGISTSIQGFLVTAPSK